MSWPDEPRILVASRIRNCLMHNGARVDDRLAAATPMDFAVGQRICFRPSDVHDYGITARRFATGLWSEIAARHFGET